MVLFNYKNIFSEVKSAKFFLIQFYVIAIIGFSIPSLKNLFINLTPLALLISAFFLFKFQETKFTAAQIIVFSVIFILGYFIEVIGVKTGLIFGSYWYGDALGIKLLNTPFLIGLNWLVLTYSTSIIAQKFNKNVFVRAVIAAFLMLVFDLVLEQIAPNTNMWFWKDSIIPIKNFVAWFVIAFFFQILVTYFKFGINNSLAAFIFYLQFFFFLVLYLIQIIF